MHFKDRSLADIGEWNDIMSIWKLSYHHICFSIEELFCLLCGVYEGLLAPHAYAHLCLDGSGLHHSNI